MRIHSNRIRKSYTTQICWNLDTLPSIQQQGSECPVGTIYMEPYVVLAADRGDFTKRVYSTCAYRACCPYDEKRQITGTDVTASACAFHIAQLAIESSEARIPGFNSAGLTQYLNRVEPFDGILSGQVTVGLVGLFSPVVTNTFIGYADFEGVVLDGVQVSSTNGSGDGALSGVLSFQIAREGLPPIDGQVDYREITLSGGNESGNYLITLDGGTQVRVPTGPWSPPLAQCLGF